MKNIGDLSAESYGIMIFPPILFNEYLKLHKIRARKFISYFDKNKDFFFSSIKDGIIIPIYQICSFEYDLFVSINENNNEIPKDYAKVYEYNDFFIEVGNDNKLCFASFSFMEYNGSLIKKGITHQSRMTPSGTEEILENYNTALDMKIEKGIYSLDIIGLERKNKLERESKNYAYLFRFTPKEDMVNNNFIKADNDNHTFDILQYKKLHIVQ